MTEHLDLSVIEKDLCREGLEPVGGPAWLRESHDKPASFWRALMAAHDPLLPWPKKSIPLEKYNFYHDIVIRNQRSTAPAFRWYDPVLGRQEASYPELGAMAGRTAAHWARSGVARGQKLCLVYPMGIHFVVALVAALKLGLIISVLPPQGRGFLKRRLEALEPDHIAIERFHHSLIPEWLKCAIPEERAADGTEAVVDRSHTYPSGVTLALCFDPCREEFLEPWELTSDAAYLCSLRDGLIALGLRPGYAFAAPGFHFLEAQPAMLLACLLNGATYVHLEPEQIEKNPELLSASPLRSVGICTRVREILLEHPLDVSKSWTHWFRNPAESSDIEVWQLFIEAMGLQEVYAGNRRWNASLGGCLLFSVSRKGRPTVNVLPSAGVRWSLTDPVAGEAGLAGDMGVFSPVEIKQEEPKGFPSPDMIARGRGEWIYIGPRHSGRGGRVYPLDEVIEAVRTVPRCARVTMAAAPVLGGGAGRAFVLLIFSGDGLSPDQAGLCKAIEGAISREMGGEYMPDRIQFFPLFPRRDEEGAMDHDWCRSQYLTGGLSRKSRGEVYQCLNRLRGYVFMD